MLFWIKILLVDVLVSIITNAWAWQSYTGTIDKNLPHKIISHSQSKFHSKQYVNRVFDLLTSYRPPQFIMPQQFVSPVWALQRTKM